MPEIQVPQLGVDDEMARELVIAAGQHNQSGAAQHPQMFGGNHRLAAGLARQLDDHARFAGGQFQQHRAPQRRTDGLEQCRLVGVPFGGQAAGSGNSAIHWFFDENGWFAEVIQDKTGF